MSPKKLLASKTVWGLLAIAVPYADQLVAYAANLPAGTLPKGAALAISGLGWLLALYGRLQAKQPIKSVI